MPVSGAVERRRRQDALQNDLRDQRHRNRVGREEAMRDRHANYQTNRLNAADAIGSQYGDATRSAYLQGRSRGGAAGETASAATAQGMRTANYVGQQNTFANDAANRYGVTRTADANYLTGEGNRMVGYGAMHEPFERTRQAQIAGDAQLGVADRQLAGVYDTNSTSRFANVNDNRTDLYQTDMSAGVDVARIASEERIARAPVAQERSDLVVMDAGKDRQVAYDPDTGRAVTPETLDEVGRQQQELRQAPGAIQQYRAQDAEEANVVLDKLIDSYMESNPDADEDDVMNRFLEGDLAIDYRTALEQSRGMKARPGEYWGGANNLLNPRARTVGNIADSASGGPLRRLIFGE